MTFHLPKPIAAYFTADRTDSDAVAQCFTDNAVVTDEGRTHSGLAAIEQWKTGSRKKYTYTSEPFASEEKDGKTIVTSRVTGGVEGSKIASLEVIL